MKRFAHIKLLPGYALTSTKKHPKEPDTVIVGEDECSQARCVGACYLTNETHSLQWVGFKIPSKNRYYFQYRPW